MGSLLPGWDTPVQQIKGREQEEETSELPKGYFAKLERIKSMRHPASEPPNADFVAALPRAYSLTRESLPATVSEIEAAISAMAPAQSPRSPGLSRKSATPMMEQHSISKVEDARASLDQRTSFHHPHVTTDWSMELKSLGGQKVELRAVKSTTEQSIRDAWWSHLDSSALNARPDVDEPVHSPNKKQPEHYTPQFGVAGQKFPAYKSLLEPQPREPEA